MVMDLAHSSPRLAAEALEMVSSPVIVSHTGIYSHCEVKRNFLDILMVEVARSGGVIGIGYWKDVTCDDSPEGVAAGDQGGDRGGGRGSRLARLRFRRLGGHGV